jgi:2-polyprenyl-3-methyl-5-hydroxy-6-metoxy-1,4-benzoquinol methylase
LKNLTSRLSKDPYPKDFYSNLYHFEKVHWWFISRLKLILWCLNKKVLNFSTFLDIGCGTGFVLHGISSRFPSAKLFGTEYYKEGLSFARKNIVSANFSQLDAKKMTDYSIYDVIGAFDVLEHIDEDQKVINNLAKALRPNGSLIVTVPQHKWLWSVTDEYACHQRRYNRKEILNKIKESGLCITYCSSFVFLLFPLMILQRYRNSTTNYDPLSEFKISKLINTVLRYVMVVEFVLIKLGLRFPIGGSLLIVAQK